VDERRFERRVSVPKITRGLSPPWLAFSTANDTTTGLEARVDSRKYAALEAPALPRSYAVFRWGLAGFSRTPLSR
jgi:hypothetical protein